MKYPDDFSLFWKLWPGRWQPKNDRIVKVGKYKAFEIWKKIPQQEQVEIIALLKSNRVKEAGTQFLPDAHRWLKGHGWDDFI